MTGVLRDRGQDDLAHRVQHLTRNHAGPELSLPEDVVKVWPTYKDREVYEAVLCADTPDDVPAHARDSRSGRPGRGAGSPTSPPMPGTPGRGGGT